MKKVKLTKAQADVLRQMVDLRSTVMTTLRQAGAHSAFISGADTVRVPTLQSLERLGYVEDISDPAWRWRGREYQITKAGRAALNGATP